MKIPSKILQKIIGTLVLTQAPSLGLSAADLPGRGGPLPIDNIEQIDPFQELENDWQEVRWKLETIRYSDKELKITSKNGELKITGTILDEAKRQPVLAGYMLACRIIREAAKKKVDMLNLISEIQDKHQGLYSLVSSGAYDAPGAEQRLLEISREINAQYETNQTILDEQFRTICTHILQRFTPCTVVKQSHIVKENPDLYYMFRQERNKGELENINPGAYIEINPVRIPLDITLLGDKKEILAETDVLLDYLEGHLRMNQHNFSFFEVPTNWSLQTISKVSQLERLNSILHGIALASGIFYETGYRQVKDDFFLKILRCENDESRYLIPGTLDSSPGFLPGVTNINLPSSSELEDKHLHLIRMLPHLRELRIPNCKIFQQVVTERQMNGQTLFFYDGDTIETEFIAPEVSTNYLSPEESRRVLDEMLTSLNSRYIEVLDISGQNISGISARKIIEFNKLSMLNLSGCQEIDADSWEALLGGLSRDISVLYINNTRITSECLRRISGDETRGLQTVQVSLYPNLKAIGLSYNMNIPSNAWGRILRGLPVNLENISLDSTSIDQSGAAELSRFENLKELSLNGCVNIPKAEWLRFVGDLSSELRTIDISNTSIDDDSIAVLCSPKFPNLTNIGVMNNYNITSTAKTLVRDRQDFGDSAEYRRRIAEREMHPVRIPQDALENMDAFIHFIEQCIANRAKDFTIFIERNNLGSNLISYLDQLIRQNGLTKDPWEYVRVTRQDQLVKLSELEQQLRLQGFLNYQFGIRRVELTGPENTLHPLAFDFLFKHLGNLRTLHVPNLTNIPEMLEAFVDRVNNTSIESLDLSKMQMPADVTFSRTLCRSLVHLNLSDCSGISNEKWGNICMQQFPLLESLNLEGTHLGESVHQLFRNAPKLKSINLSRCSEIAEERWDYLLRNVPKDVIELKLNNVAIPNGLVRRFKIFNALESLSLNGLTTWKEQDWNNLFSESLPVTLKHLSLQQNRIGDNAAQLLRKFDNLTTLNLSGCEEITEDGCMEILSNISIELIELRLDGTKVSDDAILDIIENFKKLRHLSLRNCISISSEAVNILLRKLPDSLEYLSLSKTRFNGTNLKTRKLNRLVNLKKLHIEGCNLGANWNDLPEALPPGIIEINVCDTDCPDGVLEQLRSIPGCNVLCIPIPAPAVAGDSQSRDNNIDIDSQSDQHQNRGSQPASGAGSRRKGGGSCNIL